MSLVCAILVAYLHFSYAENRPEDYVVTHNQFRRFVGVGPVKWDNKLAKLAENYANKQKANCALEDSSYSSKYGENRATGSRDDFTGVEAVYLWYKEKSLYDYKSNSCSKKNVCEHYTQVVWRKTTVIGCARVNCGKDKNTWLVVCYYDPSGNIVGEKPY